jgi:hypothetical protein
VSAGEWQTITTWSATPGSDGGWYVSKPPESEASDEADYAGASMRAGSLLEPVHDAQVIHDGARARCGLRDPA